MRRQQENTMCLGMHVSRRKHKRIKTKGEMLRTFRKLLGSSEAGREGMHRRGWIGK